MAPGTVLITGDWITWLRSVRQTDGQRDAVPERHVLVETGPADGDAVEAGDPGGVEERRDARGERCRPRQGGRRGDKPIAVSGRAGRHVEHAYLHARLDGQKRGAVGPAERLAEIIDAGGVQVRGPSPSTSIPTSITRTSCIRSATVCRCPSRSRMIVPRCGRASMPFVIR